MSSDFLSDDLDNDEYAALLRGLQWIEGFGVFFVECTPAQAQALILSLSSELADKKIQTLSLDSEIKDLRECISQLTQSEAIEVLFLTGLEKSFVPYIKAGYGGEGNYYKEDSVPPVLGRLNLDREAFKQAFPHLAIVCILPKFGIKYFIRRAPDFFDWRSGLFCFPESSENHQKMEKETTSLIDKIKKFVFSIIQFFVTLIRDPVGIRSLYHMGMGTFYDRSLKNYQKALYHYDEVLLLQPKEHRYWYFKGLVFHKLQRYEEELECYDNALKIKFDYVDSLIFKFRYSIHYKYWFSRGLALSKLGRGEEAVASYDKAIAIKPADYQAWFYRGNVLYDLGKKKEALANYDKAIAIKPDYYLAWFGRGYVLSNLGQKEEALTHYKKAITIKPYYYQAWFSYGCILHGLGQKEEALASYDQAITIKPNYYLAWVIRGDVLDDLGKKEEALVSYDKAITIKHDDSLAWNNRGLLLWKQGKLVEAAESFATALAIKPDYFFALSNDIELALVQQDFSRMQQRITTILPLLKSNEKYFVIVPFLQWLASPADSPQTVITAIQQLEANTPIDWDFEDMQPAIARLTPAQQQIAQTFIAFFQNKIDFETLQKQITA